jgi:hypothetical protein
MWPQATPFSKSLSCHFDRNWAAREVGAKKKTVPEPSAMSKQNCSSKKYRLMRLVSGDSPEQPTLHRGSIFFCTCLSKRLIVQRQSRGPHNTIARMNTAVERPGKFANLRLTHLQEGELTAYEQLMLHPGQRAGVYGWRRTSFAARRDGARNFAADRGR